MDRRIIVSTKKILLLNELEPLVTQERVSVILADGGFYKWDLINWLKQKKVFFVIKGKLNSGVKFLVKIY